MAGPGYGYVFFKNQTGATTSLSISIAGTRMAFITNATTYPTTMFLQLKGPSGAFININAATITADGMTVYDLPGGSYQVTCAGGAPAGVYASLISVPY